MFTDEFKREPLNILGWFAANVPWSSLGVVQFHGELTQQSYAPMICTNEPLKDAAVLYSTLFPLMAELD